MESAPVEVTVRLYGWGSGESEVELSIPETSDLGRLLASRSADEQGMIFARLRRHLVAELADAFADLESPREPARSLG
ncbi:MAG: hypothetical protein ACRDZ3_05915 [Acidimicrobiia bacterium]